MLTDISLSGSSTGVKEPFLCGQIDFRRSLDPFNNDLKPTLDRERDDAGVTASAAGCSNPTVCCMAASCSASSPVAGGQSTPVDELQ
eukprot:824296-Prymnesium_polylepis.1